jgi:hypothetical protein
MHPTSKYTLRPSHEVEVTRQDLREAVGELDAAEEAGEPARLSQALARVGRCHRRLGGLAEADWYIKRGLQLARGLAAVDATIDALCEVAELSVDRADLLDGQNEPRGARRLRDVARDHGFEAARLALCATDPQWGINVLLRVADLFERLGDRDDAITLQCRALGLMTGAADAGARATESPTA